MIASNGAISLDFFGLQNGRKIVEKSTGVVTLSNAGVLVITMTNERSYVLRGWLEGPTMTVMTLNGPWYERHPGGHSHQSRPGLEPRQVLGSHAHDEVRRQSSLQWRRRSG